MNVKGSSQDKKAMLRSLRSQVSGCSCWLLLLVVAGVGCFCWLLLVLVVAAGCCCSLRAVNAVWFAVCSAAVSFSSLIF